MQTIFLGHFAL